MTRLTAHFIIWPLVLVTGCSPVLHVTIDPVPGGEVARVRCEGAAVEISSPATLTVREVE